LHGIMMKKMTFRNGGVADYFSVFATVDPKLGHEGICAFLVEKSWKDVSIGKTIPKLGQRCSNTAGLKLKNVRVPKENLLAPPGEGFILAMHTYQPIMPALEDLPMFRKKNRLETDKNGTIKPAWRCRMCGHIHYGKNRPRNALIASSRKAPLKKYSCSGRCRTGFKRIIEEVYKTRSQMLILFFQFRTDCPGDIDDGIRLSDIFTCPHFLSLVYPRGL
jgi:hypothetical protein